MCEGGGLVRGEVEVRMLTSTPDDEDDNQEEDVDDGKGFRCALSWAWVSYNLVL